MSDLLQLSWVQWALIILSAFFAGMAKAGVAGVGMLPIFLMAEVFHARVSTGMTLLLLVPADFMAIRLFHQHAQWQHLRRILPPALVGVGIGAFLMGRIPDEEFRRAIGGITLAMMVLQVLRQRLGAWVESSFESLPFAWGMGMTGGVTTMVANASGPVMTLYFLLLRLPKLELVGTASWFFLLLNLAKLPLSAAQGLLTVTGLWLALLMLPVLWLGTRLGSWVTRHISQRLFEGLMLFFCLVGAVRMLFF